jgi:xylulose-5-phosphate/fructose-6-phosphate phosphoketolase
MIVLRTPKGWTGPRFVDGLPVLNSFRAHQVPLTAVRKDDGQLDQLKDWLASYKPAELFDATADNVVRPSTIAILPKDTTKRLGQVAITYKGYKALKCPDWQPFATKKNVEESPMKAIGRYLAEIVKHNVSTAFFIGARAYLDFLLADICLL